MEDETMQDSWTNWEMMKKTRSLLRNMNMVKNRISLLKRQQQNKIKQINWLMTSKSDKMVNQSMKKTTELVLHKERKKVQQQIQQQRINNKSKRQQHYHILDQFKKKRSQKNKLLRKEKKKNVYAGNLLIQRLREEQLRKNRQKRNFIKENQLKKNIHIDMFWKDRLADIHKAKEQDAKKNIIRYEGNRIELLDYEQEQLINIEQFERIQKEKKTLMASLKQLPAVHKFTKLSYHDDT